jgi:hypothetical protein
MTTVFVDTLRSWQNFYFMSGGASAGLLGLMFVALSLGMHLVNDQTREDMHTFVTPSIVYFVSVLLTCCLMLVPDHTPSALALIFFSGGLVGLVRTLPYVRQLIQAANQHGDFEHADWLSQIILPVLSYALIVLAAICFAVGQWSLAFMGVWLTTILLLVCGIMNTWSLVIWIIEQRKD